MTHDQRTNIRTILEKALAKPVAQSDDDMGDEFFNPWEDIFPSIYGNYANESDEIMLAALRACRDRTTFDLIKERGFIAEFALYVLAGHGLIDYGTSPRGGWPDYEIEDLWDALIDKWEEYYRKEWDD